MNKRLWNNTGKVSFNAKEQQRWFSLVVELLNTGFSLKEAVEFSRTLLPNLDEPISKINGKLRDGNTLAAAIRPWVSIDTYYQLMLAEQHGQLLATFSLFSDFLRLRSQQTAKLKRLLQYPILLCGLLFIIITVMAIFVFPELDQFGNRVGSGWWQRIWQPLLVCVGALVTWSIYRWVAFYHLKKIEQVRLLCRLPFFGNIFRHYYGYYLCSNLSLLIAEGLSLQKMIELCSKFSDHSLLHQITKEVRPVVMAGKSIDNIIYQEPFIPNELAVLIHQGATSEKLGLQVNSLATLLFRRVIHDCESRLNFVQPLMYLVIAGVIVTLYLQMLMPIYQTMQVIK